ncbi:MAG: hypothetical protein IH934_00995 [Nanoarchaeota archaeon]|nr:hypothetical protein [Nanoarchaeota archaeon]
MYEKSQVSIEFFTLIGLAFLMVIIIVAASANEVKEFRDQKEFFLIKDLALKLQKEVSIAASVEDGYVRSFTLPDKLDNIVDYSIRIRNNSITVDSLKTAYFVAIVNVTGYFTKGNNKIEKINGQIYINGGVGSGGEGGGESGGEGGPLDEVASQLTANTNKSLPSDWHGAKGDKDNIVLKLISDVSYDIYLESFTLSWNDPANKLRHFQHLTEANGWSKVKIWDNGDQSSPVVDVFDDNGDADANLKIPANKYTIIDDLHYKKNIILPTDFTLVLNFNDGTSSTLSLTIS